MSELDEWEQEKIRRLQGKGDGKKDEGPGAGAADEPPPEVEGGLGPSAPEDKPYTPARKTWPPRDLGNPFTVKLSVLIAFLIGAFVVMPISLVPAALVFKGTEVRAAALVIAFLSLAPIQIFLEHTRWCGERRISVTTLILGVLGGSALVAVLLFSLKTLERQEEYAKAVERKNIVSEKQLPLAGYEHEEHTAKYLKKVRGLRASIEPPPRQDKERWYGDYRRIYVEPLTEMGYEFDITLNKAIDRYVGRPVRHKSGDEPELIVFNAVCFRERLLSDGLISPDTSDKLIQLILQWSERLPPETGESPPGNEFTRFESRCPITDITFLFK